MIQVMEIFSTLWITYRKLAILVLLMVDQISLHHL
jgi:hypothetical protein